MGRTNLGLRFNIRYHKGSMNTLVDAFNHIHEVNMPSFIEIKYDIYEQF